MRPDAVFFMIPGQVHSWHLSDDAEGFVIFFTQEFYHTEYPHRKLFDFPFFNALLQKHVLYVSPKDKNKLTETLQTLMEEHKSQKLLKNRMVSRYLDILLIQLTRLHQPQVTATEVQGNVHSLLQNLDRLIDKHYREHVPVSFYADRLHVTTKYLNDTCKRHWGKTTHELIQYRTLLEAKRLLVHSELTASQVAAELGYFDNTYFFRFFKKKTGYTPEQFRNANAGII